MFGLILTVRRSTQAVQLDKCHDQQSDRFLTAGCFFFVKRGTTSKLRSDDSKIIYNRRKVTDTKIKKQPVFSYQRDT